MSKKPDESVNIFDLLGEEPPKEKKEEKKPKTVRDELLTPLNVEDRFEEGSITIDKRTCRGVECKLCIDVCPTNALYWKAGEVGIIEDLCLHCGACVLNCMVDDCIKITRKRPDGTTETFSNPKDVMTLNCVLGSNKRNERLESLFPTVKEYFDRYGE